MFNCLSTHHKASLYCIGLLCSLRSTSNWRIRWFSALFASLLISGQALAKDYLQVETPGLEGIGVYYDEMFRGKVNPAAVGYRRESLAFDLVTEPFESSFLPNKISALSFHTEYNDNRFSISDRRSELALARVHFENDKVGDAYKPLQEIDELFQVTTSFNIDVTKSIRIGVGQRFSHLTGLHFERKKKSPTFTYRDFDMNLTSVNMDLTSFAVDVGTAIRLSRNLYLSLYGQNALYFTFGEPSIIPETSEPIILATGEKVMPITPELDVQAPIVVGGGPSIALAQLVASIDAYYLPQVGDAPGIRGTAFYTIFLGRDSSRIKLGVGAESIVNSDWLDNFKTEAVASVWASERLSSKYAIGFARSPEDEKGRVYQRAGVSWLWE